MKYLMLALIAFLGACAPSRHVKPLEKGQQALGASYGGGLVKVPGVGAMPTPFMSLSYSRGITEKATVFGSYHTTAAIFGTFQTDIGAVYELYKNEEAKYGVSVTPVANIMVDRWEKQWKFYPQLDANFYWTYSEKTKATSEAHDGGSDKLMKRFLYAGVTNWFELANTRVHDEPQPYRWIFNPHIGHTFERPRMNYQFEFKWLAPNIDNAGLAVDYVSPFGTKGALGVFFHAAYKF
jgi:hypothetical protein